MPNLEDQEEIDLKEMKTTNATTPKESSNPSSASAQKTKETDNADKTVNKLPNTSTNQYTWLLVGLLFLFSGGIWFMANKKKTNK